MVEIRIRKGKIVKTWLSFDILPNREMNPKRGHIIHLMRQSQFNKPIAFLIDVN